MFVKISGVLAAGWLLLAPCTFAQPPADRPAQTRPAFEVATIKPVATAQLTPQAIASGQLRIGVNVTGSRVDIGFVSIADLIGTAYGLKPYQVDGPSWLKTERFEITAKLPEGATRDDVNPMLQTLLAERFGLTSHREQKERPIYALLVRDASKLTPAAPDSEEAAKSDAPPLLSANGATISQPQQTANGMTTTVSSAATGPVKIAMTAAGEHIDALRLTMTALVDLLSPMVERPIVNMTNLDGAYHVTLDIPLAELMVIAQRAMAQMGVQMPAAPNLPGAAAGQASDPGGSSIFDSLQQIGLRLDARNAPIDVLIVDKVERAPKED